MIDRSTLKTALAMKQDCLSVQELERLLDDPSKQNPHLASCPRCQAELAMLKNSKRPPRFRARVQPWLGSVQTSSAGWSKSRTLAKSRELRQLPRVGLRGYSPLAMQGG